MTDGVPLSLLLEPGEYYVMWDVQEPDGSVISIPGTATLMANQMPSGSAQGPMILESEPGGRSEFGINLPQIRNTEFLWGRLLNGKYILFVDAVLELFGPGALIHARAALVGHTRREIAALQINHVKIQVEGLDALAARTPLGRVIGPSGPDYLSGEWTVPGQPTSSQMWNDDSAKVEFRFDGSSTLFDPFFFRAAFSPVVHIRFAEGIPLDDLVRD